MKLMAAGVPVQIEAEEEEVGPSLPGEEERKPTTEALEQIHTLMEEKRKRENGEEAPKKRERSAWMTMMPDSSSLSSIFAAPKSRRFSNIPAGCKVLLV